jgi:hypothetical protein
MNGNKKSMKVGDRVFLADPIRNEIDECEVVREIDGRFILRRGRPQKGAENALYPKDSGYLTICESYNEALSVTKDHRLRMLRKAEDHVEVLKKKLHDVVKYYPLVNEVSNNSIA